MHDQIWAMSPLAFSRLHKLQVDARIAVPESAGQPRVRKEKAIAVLPLVGLLEPRTSLLGMLFGTGTSSVAFAKAAIDAAADDTIGGILIDASTPGGSVFGMMEAAEVIYSLRGSKPIFAIANHQADSAGYAIVSAADRIYVSPSGRVGSVGTLMVHQDASEAYAKAGVKEYVVRSDDSPYKGEWVESQPVSEGYLADMQAMVNEYQKPFVELVARNRGVTVADVRNNFGKGRDVGAKTAVASGMADGIATFDEVLSKMAEGRVKLRRSSVDSRINDAKLRMYKNCS